MFIWLFVLFLRLTQGKRVIAVIIFKWITKWKSYQTSRISFVCLLLDSKRSQGTKMFSLFRGKRKSCANNESMHSILGIQSYWPFVGYSFVLSFSCASLLWTSRWWKENERKKIIPIPTKELNSVLFAVLTDQFFFCCRQFRWNSIFYWFNLSWCSLILNLMSKIKNLSLQCENHFVNFVFLHEL